jgi:LysR family transcriptional regulator, regulator for metE and metH
LRMSQYISPRLDMGHIAVLNAIARWGTAAAAAEHLKLTPSAITHRIREAERRLGLRLTLRFGNRLRLTVAGQRLAQSAERVVDEMLRAELDAERIGRGVTSIVRLGMGTYSFFHWLPSFLRHLTRIDAGMQVDVIGEAARQPLELLHEGMVDTLLLPGSGATKGVTSYPLFVDELVCVMAPNHHLAERKFVHASDLTAETHLSYSAIAQTGFEYDSFLRPEGLYPARLITVASPEAIIELVVAGLGISILARWAVEPRLRSGELVAAQLTANGLPLRWHVIVRQTEAEDAPAARCARALLNWGSIVFKT